MPAFLTVGPGKLEYGYFYAFFNDVHLAADDADLWKLYEGSLFSTDPKQDEIFKCTVIGHDKKDDRRFKCAEYPNHGRIEAVFDYDLEIRGGPSAGAFIPESDHVVISDRFADQLKTSGLKGWRTFPCKVTEFGGPKYKPEDLPKFRQLAFEGVAPWMRPHIEPPASDKCAFCGKSGLVCPGCGEWRGPCKHCGKDWYVSAKDHEGPGDRRIVIDPDWPDVFDIRHWDGSDFIGDSGGGGGWITRRALDWLLSIHAAPFRAEPIAVNVAGLSKAELARLEEVRKPLPNVTPPALEKFTKKPRK